MSIKLSMVGEVVFLRSKGETDKNAFERA